MPSNCLKAWGCANISRHSALMASARWWTGFAPTPGPRLLRPLSEERFLSSSALLDVIAQFGNRAETQRAFRQLRFDRSIRVERVRHAVDDARFEYRHRGRHIVSPDHSRRHMRRVGALLHLDRRRVRALRNRTRR